MNTPGQASPNRTERTGWPEHDRKDRTAGTGHPRQNSHKRTDTRERLVIRSVCTSQPEGQSKMITQNIKEKLPSSQTIKFMFSFSYTIVSKVSSSQMITQNVKENLSHSQMITSTLTSSPIKHLMCRPMLAFSQMTTKML